MTATEETGMTATEETGGGGRQGGEEANGQVAG